MELTDQQQLRYGLATLAAAVVLLIAGYLIGNSGGADVNAAREAGASAGQAAGLKAGKAQGRAAGYKKGYRTAYKAAYERAKRGN